MVDFFSMGSGILTFAENHPYILLAIIVVLVICMLGQVMRGAARPSAAGRPKPVPVDDGIESLIGDINREQARLARLRQK